MLPTECIEFAKANPVGHLATTDGDQPRVRVVLLWRVQDDGFYFETLNSKQMCDQLRANPKVEVCFFNNKTEMSEAKLMRVAGEVEFLNDMSLKAQLLDDWKFLKPVFSGPEDPNLVIYRIPRGEAYFWTAANLGKEREVEHMAF